jgi:hypothetical protein
LVDGQSIVMNTKLSFLVAFSFFVFSSGSGHDPTAQDPEAHLQRLQSERLEAARVVWAKFESLERWGSSPETRHRWSCRLLDARIGAGKDERVTAYREHHERMEVLQSEVESWFEAGRTSSLETAMVGYYVAQAKLWLEQSGKD